MRNYQRERFHLKTCIREFFGERNYLEVESHVVVITPGSEEHLRYFGTTWMDYQNRPHQLWLRSSPEIHMKQILAQGENRIFQIAPCFRNHGEHSEWHHPEFSMLEWYEKGLSFPQFIDQTEEFLRFTSCRFAELVSIKNLSFPNPIPRYSLHEIFAHVGIELVDLDPYLAKKAENAGVLSINDQDDFHSAFFKVLLEKIEPILSKEEAAILYDYPPSQAALAEVEEGVAKRVEFYVKGVELSNGFKECLSFHENELRFARANKFRESMGYESHANDRHFFECLKQKIHATCGNALGIDRWLALLLGHSSVHQVIPFRHSDTYR